ncbi:hypothetical protein EDM59_21750 [Brevibacillus nitrificans]|uniref:Uncharacterized protein n=1 Tax=Brevibacillus nitrificans TaxID=651560 RepID=A0A3M8D2E6_9BACL|nr:hypothetical protein [Brevibacillus nitrificans]RNB81741.1 hypothetical protein EDM59_21750 [Brevibacillus nitrificans]
MSVSEKITGVLLLGILACLFVIAQKPSPSFYSPPASISFPKVPDSSNASVVQLDKNKIAVVDTRNDSPTFGKILVLAFDPTTNKFTQVADHTFSFDIVFR